jgi:precorrin-6Y C5,15-methyltransferase (decarboxylating)
MKGQLFVIGCGTCFQDLTASQVRLINEAEIMAGGRRLLAWFPDFQGETIELSAHVKAAVARLLDLARRKKVVVLASGDPLFFGIGSHFVETTPDVDITLIPNVTAMQQAMARLALPWSGARFFSLHGRTAPLPWRHILGAETAVVYADPKRHPGIIARELLAAFPASAGRPAAVAENLGGDEHIVRGSLSAIANRQFSALAMLVLLPPEPQGQLTAPGLSLGEDDACFIHQANLITHPEIRAVILAKLRLGPGVLWDLGAGSGSVAIEACGLCPALTAYAVEKEAQRVEMIHANIRQAGVASCRVLHQDILRAIPELPAPRAVFVGGGGKDVEKIVKEAFAFLRSGGRLVASAVLLETRDILHDSLKENRIEIVEMEIRRAVPVGPGHMMKPDNPVTLYVYEKKSA